jgi:exodeoxyribonuclease VII small subunit
MPEEPEPSFENALARIERIVDDLEQGEPSLSAALAKYEDGVKLLRRCYDLLDQAERAVALLTGVDEDGRPSIAPFDANATQSPQPDPAVPTPVASDPAPRTTGRRSPPATRSPRSQPADPSDLPF